MAIQESWRDIGNKIRYLRKSSGLTIKQLAHGCDLSANTISLVERCEVAPNIETLCKIANALGVSPSSLFLEVCQPRVVLQRVDENEGATDLAGRTLRILNSSIQTSGCTLATPKTSVSPPESPSFSRHSVLCLCGQVELELDGQNYSLNPGDNLVFNSDAFHRWRNTGSTTGIAILIIPNNPTGRQQI